MDTRKAAPGDILLTPVSALQLDAGMGPLSLALSDILKRRRTERAFRPDALSITQLSRLLWAADGCNGPGALQRTAPSASGDFNLDVYVTMESGVYRFDANDMRLTRVFSGDVRPATGRHPCVLTAPVCLIYLATYGEPDSSDPLLAALSIGHISQNVYLFCAAEDLAAYAHTDFDAHVLDQVLGLRPDQRILLTQTVGFPAQARAARPGHYDE